MLRTPIIAGALVAAITLAGLVLIGPRPIFLSNDPTGDPEITAVLQEHAERGHHNLAAFVYTDGEVRYGGLGADENTEFEIGSITKTFNAELLRQQIEEGTIGLDTTVGEIIDVPGAPIENVTMEELVNHTSGLSRLPGVSFSNLMSATFTLSNPYADVTPEDIFDIARTAELNGRGEEHYSNYGHALLGQLLAKSAGMPYSELLERKIFAPAGMEHTHLPDHPEGLTRGLGSTGHRAEPWVMDGYAPAGAIRSTAADMARYVEWVARHGRPEYGWAEAPADGTDYPYHNGATGGFRTMLVWSPDAPGEAAFVANDTAAWVDSLGLELLRSHTRSAS
ncbi:serine hydrolase domain-containing protein [Corynebacterium liangguodongii]|uniref:Serine hydrolase n=1 Tax=Corynebacterium liangguodongii TaxID=2079535 RepID=A0A2S0WDJ4_9CORY|nr:serine hydrolase domain-containing protein [Corynebacterium liangguodongii]AWB83853.1 serine hydrolase [Corynebacterium liangguodongii]PWB98973.1 serine hydrolase [Corynebacterium liangguodongii]